jgi:hypothetical protein
MLNDDQLIKSGFKWCWTVLDGVGRCWMVLDAVGR